jgi:hypothetical protein
MPSNANPAASASFGFMLDNDEIRRSLALTSDPHDFVHADPPKPRSWLPRLLASLPGLGGPRDRDAPFRATEKRGTLIATRSGSGLTCANDSRSETHATQEAGATLSHATGLCSTQRAQGVLLLRREGPVGRQCCCSC